MAGTDTHPHDTIWNRFALWGARLSWRLPPAQRVLQQMDDRLLADIGIAPCDVPRRPLRLERGSDVSRIGLNRVAG